MSIFSFSFIPVIFGGVPIKINSNDVVFGGHLTYNQGTTADFGAGVYLYDVNSSGLAVGLFETSNSVEYGYSNLNGNITTFSLGGYGITRVVGVSDAGVLYGSYTYNGVDTYGFTYDNGTVNTIDINPNATATDHGTTYIAGADSNGDFFGETYHPGTNYGVFYSSAGVLYQGSYSDFYGLQLVGVNDKGEAVGNYTVAATGYHFSVVISDGIANAFAVPGSVDTEITAINSSGEFVGIYDTNNPSGGIDTHGFVDIGGVITTVDFAGSNVTDVTGLNDAGVIVGYTLPTGQSIEYFEGTPACFLKSARIKTPKDEIAVETLRIGDLVTTASGNAKPIKWLGRRTLDGSRHRDPTTVWPIRISAGAFAENTPSRDLWLSPGHNIAFDGVLMPIGALQNGRSIVQVQRTTVEYWHIELEDHDILLAEGLPAESYLDTGNRTAFENGGAFIEAHPDFLPKHWAETCLPLVTEGPVLAAAKARLLARLAEQGHIVDSDADPHVTLDGARIEPSSRSEGRLEFELPAGGREIVLRSKTFIPAHTKAESADIRPLGLCVAAVQIDGVALALQDDATCPRGWHEAEHAEGRFTHRWTTGATPLPAGARKVTVDLAGRGFYWRSYEASAVALSA